MHLLLAQKGTIADGEEAIDLGQSPGDILFLSAADTELASLAAAQKMLGADALSLRLANLLKLRHPMSVDAYIERTARHARLIVVRLLGGESYWPYGLEALYAMAQEKGILLAIVPGDDKPDTSLARLNTVKAEDAQALWDYLREGGMENAANFLRYCRCLTGDGDLPAEAAPLLKSGVFGAFDPEGERPIVAVTFYRALVQSGQTGPIEALCEELRGEGLNPLPIFVSSLKDPVSAATVEELFGRASPDVVINLTGFAVSSPGSDRKPTVLEKTGAVVLQAIFGRYIA